MIVWNPDKLLYFISFGIWIFIYLSQVTNFIINVGKLNLKEFFTRFGLMKEIYSLLNAFNLRWEDIARRLLLAEVFFVIVARNTLSVWILALFGGNSRLYWVNSLVSSWGFTILNILLNPEFMLANWFIREHFRWMRSHIYSLNLANRLSRDLLLLRRTVTICFFVFL